MGPRKSASNWQSNVQNYSSVFLEFCREEDVLVIPEITSRRVGQSLEFPSPSKSLKSRLLGTALKELELTDELELARPPRIEVVYETFEDKENPVTVICKNIYIEFSLIYAIQKSLSPFPTITTLKIEDCCISKELGNALASILTEESGKQIVDLSLDGNPEISQILPLFLSPQTGLKILSLQRCKLDDEAVKLLADALVFNDEMEQKLLVLNLGMNKIGDLGVLHLANALRTNRTLISLSLIGNQIGDEGADHLVQVLKKFQLTQEEVELRRRKNFNLILQKKNAAEKSLGEKKSKEELDKRTSKTNARSTERKKIRGPDGKMCLSSRDQKKKLGKTKINSDEKFGSRIKTEDEESKKNSRPESTEVSSSFQQSDSKHPFVNEVFTYEGKLWCSGCWSILNLNLAYNYLTEKTVENFINVFFTKAQDFRVSKTGLTRLILLPGNNIKEDSKELQNLQNAIALHNAKKEAYEASNSISASLESPTRKLSLSSRKINARKKSVDT